MTLPLVVLLLLAGTVSVASAWDIFGYSSDCKFTREDAVKCFEKHVDTNHDGEISVLEIENARMRYEGRFMRAMQWLVSWKIDVRTEKIMHDCDFNHDGKFTSKDFLLASKTCIASQAGLCVVKKVCDKADYQDKHGSGWIF